MIRTITPSRRSFLQSGAAGIALSTVPLPLWSQARLPPLADYAAEYFLAAEWAFVMAATARLIPSDGDGPGALETRVPVFIDRQLAGGFGQASDWCMQGPHDAGAHRDFGYQSPLTPAEIYRASIPLFEAWCAARHGAGFADLTPDLQDAALQALEEDAGRRGESPGPAAGEDSPAFGSDGARILPDELTEFFALMLQNTKEGYFADPRHGGNHGMAAWVHIGFPGARASFLEWIGKDNVPYRLGPVSIDGERA